MRIGDIRIGAIDAKEEFDELAYSDKDFFDRLFLPDSIDLSSIESGRKYFFMVLGELGKPVSLDTKCSVRNR